MATIPAALPAEGRMRAAHTSTEILGLLLLAAAPLLMVSAGLVAGQSLGAEGIFFGIAAAVPLLGAALVWRFGTWAKVVGMLAGALVLLGMFWTVFGLAHPAAFADFVPGVMVPLGAAVTVGGGVAAIRAARSGTLTASSTATERRVSALVLGIVALALVASAVASVLGRTTAEAGAATQIDIKHFEFGAGSFEVASGETVRVHNGDAFLHTFTIPALGIDVTLNPGSSTAVPIDAEPGAYTFYCKPHANMDEPNPAEAGMAGTLTVQ